MNTSKVILQQYLKEIIADPVLNSNINEILAAFHPLQLYKNSFLVEKGSICSYFCFIERGILQHAIPLDQEEKTTYLALKNTCTSALESFLKGRPSRKNIKALSPCDLWVIEADDFKALLAHNTAFQKFYYNLVERQIFLIDDHRIDLLTLSPEERYSKLLKNDPHLLQEVPLHYLASLLGISTRHMSRIRKNSK